MKRLILSILLVVPAIANAQIGVGYHFSNIPFMGVNYEIGDRFKPEIRIGTDAFLEDLSIEGVLTYDILNKEDYEFYAGIGARSENLPGLVIPIGLNFYPFQEKKFGFHFEVAPIIGDDDILRGSLGIRYRFVSEDR